MDKAQHYGCWFNVGSNPTRSAKRAKSSNLFHRAIWGYRLRGQRHDPFKVAMWVRVPLALPKEYKSIR